MTQQGLVKQAASQRVPLRVKKALSTLAEKDSCSEVDSERVKSPADTKAMA